MTDQKMAAQMSRHNGLVAALDQSGGSTPDALRLYGVAESDYSSDAEMLELMHAMRLRIMRAPAFSGRQVIGAILFEHTMDSDLERKPVPAYLWQDRQVVPFVKVDKGREAEKDGVSLMKAMPQLDQVLERAVKLGVYGTKMRSLINLPSKDGIAAVVAQQFEIAERISHHGLMPILEPEVLIKSRDKKGAEAILLDELKKRVDALPEGGEVMLKLTIPDVPDLYAPLVGHDRVIRVLALSGGYSREEASRRLAANRGMIASFSRALIEDLRQHMSDPEFDRALAGAIAMIYDASTVKSAA